MMKDVRRYAVNIVLELKTPATMSMELVTWAVILATKTKLATRVSDIEGGLLRKQRTNSKSEI